MHLAFVSPFDPRSVRDWSGIPFYMRTALERHVDRVTVVAPLDRGPRLRRGAAGLARRLRGQGFSALHTEAVAARMGEHAAREVRRIRPDAVIGPSSLPFARFDADVPVAFWTDLTFESALYFYAGYGGLADADVTEGHRVERAAIHRADAALFASDFAARSATGYYGADPAAVGVVPFGANVEAPPEAMVHAAIDARPAGRLALLFLGVEWVRKGGDVAVLVADALNAAGVPTDLHVVGCAPHLDVARPYVHAHGYIDKRTPEGAARLDALLHAAHFLVMPVRAEAFGCVFCEASAYGIPSVTTSSGGAGSAVTDGENGFLFAPRPAAAEIAARILETVRAPGAYRALARSSRDAYDRRLNWDAAAQAALAVLAGR